MLSLSKLLLIALVVAGVYYAWKLLRPKAAGRPVAKRADPRALDMRKCAVCGVYVGEGEGACGKPGCPAA
jgi:uncharacterized iron-regulated membrane protein